MSLTADQEFWLATLSSIVAAVAIAIPAILAYRESIRLRRAEWLHKLFQEYYSATTYRPIRQLLDSSAGRQQLSRLVSKLATPGAGLSPEESKTLYDLTDFLSFFEFIAFLRVHGALRLEDCTVLFHYYLQLLRQDFLLDFMKRYGYALLLQLLEEVSHIPIASDGPYRGEPTVAR